MRAQHIKQLPVGLGQPTGCAGRGKGTTRPDDTITVASAIATHGQKTWALADGMNTTKQASKARAGTDRESWARPLCSYSPSASQKWPVAGCRSQPTERQGHLGAAGRPPGPRGV